MNWSFIDKNASNRFSATFHTPFFQGFSYFDTWLKNSNSINSLGLINDTSLLIHYSDTCSGLCVVRNKWRLVNLNTFETTEITEGINSFMSYESNKIANCSYPFSSTGYSKYFYTKGGIILIEALPNFTPVGKTFIEYLTLKQEYLNSNKPILTVCKFEIR